MAPTNFTEEQLQSLRSLPTYEYKMSPQAAASKSSVQTPITASTDMSAHVDYFEVSPLNTGTNSSRTSVDLQPAVASVPSKPKAANPLPPLSREYPKPAEDIDFAEALSRKPGRWTIQGAVAAKNALPDRVVDEQKEKAKRLQALAEAKKNLFAASEALKAIPMPPRKNHF